MNAMIASEEILRHFLFVIYSLIKKFNPEISHQFSLSGYRKMNWLVITPLA
jgi:hypothetical protein